MYILGINAFHADAAAALFKNGHLVAAVAEERLRREKHAAGFPVQAVRCVMDQAGVGPGELGHVAISRDPAASLGRKVLFALRRAPEARLVRDRVANAARVNDLGVTLAQALGLPRPTLRARFHHVEHHRAHLASAFYMGGRETAACLSMDGFGDFTSTMTARGCRDAVNVLGRVPFPHSAGIFYTALTQFTGFHHYGDEWKMMGLAPLGRPVFREQLARMIRLLPRGRFELDLSYFLHHVDGGQVTWEEGTPHQGRLWSDRLSGLLGPPRDPLSDDATGKWADIASSAQAVYEDVLFHVLCHLHDVTGETRLCLAGGCALNSVANGRITERTPFTDVFIPPAPADDGTALGAAAHVAFSVLGLPRDQAMTHAAFGPAYTDAQMVDALRAAHVGGDVVIDQLDDDTMCGRVAAALADGRVVGWFQGGMEFGPRALGNRSILADPRRAEMRTVLNERIKQREPFRPFAPSVLEESVHDVFEGTGPFTFMSTTSRVREAWRTRIPAVTHVDHTSRVHAVGRETNPRFHALLSAFERLTGCPLVLNTSFNENEPMVMTPRDALECFTRTGLDVLALGPYLLERHR